MLQFPENYFEREMRDGHLVGELIKRAWAVQLDILDRIDSICTKYGLTYFAYWGTLIGAVRHQGFIPWDDDLDIAMPRPDYMRFLEVVQDELSDEYQLLNNYVTEWENSFSRIVKGRDFYSTEEALAQNYNFPFFLGIDIFPLDYISRDEREAREQCEIMRHIGTLVTVVNERKKAEKENATIEVLNAYNESIASSLVKLEKLCGIRFEGNIPLNKQLNILYDQIAGLFTAEESDYMTDFPGYLRNGYIVKKEWFNRIERVPFENITIPIPMGYDGILRRSHGNYTIPIKGGSTHGDVYFRPQIKILSEKLDLIVKKEIDDGEQVRMITDVKENIKNKRVKYIMIYNDTCETIANDVGVVEKMRSVFREIAGNENVRIWWRASRIDLPEMCIVEKFLPQLVKEYRELIKEFQTRNLGFLDPGVNIDFALENCCAYYGVENKISRLFQLSEKPVMIMNFDIK